MASKQLAVSNGSGKTGKLEPDVQFDDLLIRIKSAYRNPNVGHIQQAVLKDGPRTFKVATLIEIVNPISRSAHHYELKIDHVDRKKAGWFHKPEKSVRLSSEEPNEIEKLHRFLSAHSDGMLDDETGELHLIKSDDYRKLEELISCLPNLANTDKFELIREILKGIGSATEQLQEFISVFQESSGETLEHIATASRLVQYERALDELKRLVDEPDSVEGDFQKHLDANPWMFGSEYSELLKRRTWTRDDRLDYMLRRTADGILEIVEIKTAFKNPLFVYDSDRDVYYPSSKLSPVIGQVTRYIEEIERNRDQILAKDHQETLKIKAVAIVGRDGGSEQANALRNLNGHLHRIEIITFDQLIKIAERVVSMFREEQPMAPDEEPEDDEIPF